MNDATRNIRLLVAYDGTDFSGWQRQGEKGPQPFSPCLKQFCPGQNCTDEVDAGRLRVRTVQGVIEAALEKIHKHPVALTGSGRTDAGVHAAGQVANFSTDIERIDAARFIPALNGFLPRDVRILEALETLPDFHARFDARSRMYRYHFICGRPALPHELRYNLQLWRRPDISLLNAYARLLQGEINCSVFAWPKDPSESRNRYFFHAGFFMQGDTLIFEVQANAFLWKMVRSIVGTLLYYEEKRLPPEELQKIIVSGDRSLAGPTVPPNGLFLWKVEYYR
ncbi:tRNA pseudouridine synthase A (tRNA-uridine isomeraseI) (tRNA pseudouridylate synthase I) (PSU-I) [Treponema primitia ZAS-2]|uniref:tRNA pseudouridine synthase A n=1 Tax=Treponema primitia (strain ATCC BAA-887 / DSM 12427 / ZAS-2) TaxID=545694 RepID=F5YKJ4_TREPZ|nr:tRNA pseudouridine synthase A [Treponema primitia]AEF85363.1 tRNA pseudouridine synthase A (tRNA-uridine isomeraseI) (tRNA pseudouridylate synthase I) (PSU-I) [Treponema primitia ZAS-2]